MAFKACEPSDAMIRALQARIGAKGAVADRGPGFGLDQMFPPAPISSGPALFEAGGNPLPHAARLPSASSPSMQLAGDQGLAYKAAAPSVASTAAPTAAPRGRAGADFAAVPNGPTGPGRPERGLPQDAPASSSRASRPARSADSRKPPPIGGAASKPIGSLESKEGSARGLPPIGTALLAMSSQRPPQQPSEDNALRGAASSSRQPTPDVESSQAVASTAGGSRPSTTSRLRQTPPLLPSTPPRPVALSSTTALAEEQVLKVRAQAEQMREECATLEERLRQVEQSQAEAMAVATEAIIAPRQAMPADDPRLPSAVTVAGIPVAADGELVYLGGGFYAATAAPEPQPQRPPPRKKKVMPGRTRVHHPMGLRSAIRSASAHLVGPQSGTGDTSPCPSRAHSEGQLGGRPASGMSAGTDGSRGARGRKEPQGWRPAGVQKLPPAPQPPPRRADSAPQVDCLGPSGGHSEARADARKAHQREMREAGLFGPSSIFTHFRDGEELRQDPPSPPIAAAGPPLNGDRRAAERKAAKEARVQQILEERAERKAAEASVMKAARMQRHYASASAPLLHGERSQEDLEKQKLRLACKMEMLDFFNAYRNPMTKMSAEQTKLLLAKLHGGEAAGGAHAEAEEQSSGGEDESQEDAEEPAGPSLGAPPKPSVHERLQQFNDACNRAFEVEQDREEEDASMDITL